MKYTETNEWKDYLELVDKRPALFTKNGYLDIVLDDNIINEYVSKQNVKLGVVYTFRKLNFKYISKLWHTIDRICDRDCKIKIKDDVVIYNENGSKERNSLRIVDCVLCAIIGMAIFICVSKLLNIIEDKAMGVIFGGNLNWIQSAVDIGVFGLISAGLNASFKIPDISESFKKIGYSFIDVGRIIKFIFTTKR